MGPAARLPIAITPGEPAGIGPEVVVRMLAERRPEQAVIIADRGLMNFWADRLQTRLRFVDQAGGPDEYSCQHVPLVVPAQAGQLNPANADYVLQTLRLAVDGCTTGRYAGLVTAPVHKGVINDAGFPFSGHTEFLAQRTGTDQVVMMLVAGDLRVALATTHLPLREVAEAITADRLERVLRVLHGDLIQRFGLPRPRIVVCGLNPHAGEGGHLGREELDLIAPLCERLTGEGLQLRGPLPADTAFTPRVLEQADAVLAMYHDQGLPVLKYAGFGEAVNVTLGLPMVRTSVDHGTALDIAGQGRADHRSLVAAWDLAVALIGHGS